MEMAESLMEKWMVPNINVRTFYTNSLLESSIKTVALGRVKMTLPAGTMRTPRARENHSSSGSTIRSSNACRVTVIL